MLGTRQYEPSVQLALTPELLDVVFWIFVIWFVVVGIFIALGE
jgi:hypothetical protein